MDDDLEDLPLAELMQRIDAGTEVPIRPVCPPADEKRHDWLDDFRRFELDSLLHADGRFKRLLVVRASGTGFPPWRPPELPDVELATFEYAIDHWEPDPEDRTRMRPVVAGQEPEPRGPCEAVSKDPDTTPALSWWTYWLALDDDGTTDSGLELDHALELARRQFCHDCSVWLRRRDSLPTREGFMLSRADRIRIHHGKKARKPPRAADILPCRP